MKRLLAVPYFNQLCMYEKKHRSIVKEPGIMCDVYDSPRWRKVAGAIDRTLTRIVLHVSVDGVPAFGRKNCTNIGSVKPINYFVANLPPWLR